MAEKEKTKKRLFIHLNKIYKMMYHTNANNKKKGCSIPNLRSRNQDVYVYKISKSNMKSINWLSVDIL